MAAWAAIALTAAAEKPTPAPSESPTPEPEFDIPVKEGVPVRGITVPHFDANGKQTMLFKAEVARKLDADHLEMENLNIEGTGDDGKKFYIALPKSVFNLQTRILTGDSSVFIRREDFEISGDTGEFHTKTRFAKIFGNIKMTIFNTDQLDRQ